MLDTGRPFLDQKVNVHAMKNSLPIAWIISFAAACQVTTAGAELRDDSRTQALLRYPDQRAHYS